MLEPKTTRVFNLADSCITIGVILLIYDALTDLLSASKLKYYIKNKIIEIVPLAFMRGRTLDSSFVILDEAQNATVSQMKMFLTRMGMSAKFIITGDETQVDLPLGQKSGLVEAVELLVNVEGVAICRLTSKDVVRHPIVQRVIDAYARKRNNREIRTK